MANLRDLLKLFMFQVKEKFVEIATKIGELQHSCGLDIQVEDYLEEFNFDLMDIVFEWARGVKVITTVTPRYNMLQCNENLI